MIDRREEIITSVFRVCAEFARESGDGRWKLGLANGRTIPVSAHLLDDWLILDAPLEESRGLIDCWPLLALNSGLSGPGKIALLQGKVRARAEVVLPDDESLSIRPAEACAGIIELMEAVERPKAHVRKKETSSVASARAGAQISLADVCKEAGWEFVERVEGVLAVGLETRAGFHQALIEQSGAGALVGVEIARATSLTQSSRRAIAALLLRASGQIRMARAAVEERGEQSVIRLEARSGPCAEDLRSALSALSIACDCSAREVAHLQDDRVAAWYLAIDRV